MNLIRNSKKFSIEYQKLLLICLFVICVLVLIFECYKNHLLILEYESQKQLLEQIKKLTTAPTAENLRDQEADLHCTERIFTVLKNRFEQYKFPTDFGDYRFSPTNPQLFQDVLNQDVIKIQQQAQSLGIILPNHFYLGMEEYEISPPKITEVEKLFYELIVWSWIADKLVKNRINILTFKTYQQNQIDKLEFSVSQFYHLPNSSTLKISFLSTQVAFQAFIDEINRAPYLIIIDSISIKNTQSELPKLSQFDNKLIFIFGKEKLFIQLNIKFINPKLILENV